MDLALPGAKYYREFLVSVVFLLCEQPQKSGQKRVPALTEREKGADTGVLAIDAAMI